MSAPDDRLPDQTPAIVMTPVPHPELAQWRHAAERRKEERNLGNGFVSTSSDGLMIAMVPKPQ